MNRLWHIPPPQLQNHTGELATRATTVAFLTCQVRAASRSNKFQYMLWHQANAFRYTDPSESRCYQLPSHTLWIKYQGSESRTAYQCPHWKCARLAFCINACVAGAREHSPGALEDFAGFFCTHIRWRHSRMVTPDPPKAPIMNLVASYSTESQGMSSTPSKSNRKPLFDVTIAFNLPMP